MTLVAVIEFSPCWQTLSLFQLINYLSVGSLIYNDGDSCANIDKSLVFCQSRPLKVTPQQRSVSYIVCFFIVSSK